MKKAIVRNEIGSEFWDIPTSADKKLVFPENAKWFVSGASALRFILEDILRKKSIRRAAIPSWCCSTMIAPFLERDLEVFFYSVRIDDAGRLTCDYSTTPVCDVTLVISYFGYTGQAAVGSPGGIIINDLTHSLFCGKKQFGDYYFGSLRKWAGFWTGGYAWKTGSWDISGEIPEADPAYVLMRRGAMQEKTLYLCGKHDDKTYLKQFEQAEEYLEHCGIMGASPRDVLRAPYFDLDTVKKKRQTNAAYLLSELRDYALFKNVGDDDCPLFVPLILETEARDHLRQSLKEKSVYCPIHWAVTERHQLTGEQRYLYEHELSIVCDQRYGEQEMRRTLDLIGECLRNCRIR